MASQTHEIAFKIVSNMQGNFAKNFSAASSAVSGFNKSLNAVNHQAAQVDKIIRLRKETGEAARAYSQAKQKVAELGRQLHNTEQPTQQMINEFNRAKDATTKAKNELNKKREALKAVEEAAGTTGESLRDLIKRQGQLADSAEKARIAQEKMAKATELQGKFKNMASAGLMGMGTTAAAAAPAVLTVKAAMDFEDMRAELGKYSDEAGEIFKGIENLTGKYSKSAADMTAMAANSMQSGVAKTKQEVLELVESQTQAAVAFGMTGDAVGSAWADIQAKMWMNVTQTKAVFDIANKLGNETSASSEDILNVLQRQGGTVKSLTALNEKQITAMAGAFRSASNSSEVAATSMGTFVSRLTVGSTATKAQQKAFEALGLDAEDLAKRMTSSSDSAQSAIQDVFARINNLSADKRGAVIGQIFGNEAGIKAAVATLSKNSNMLGDNLKVVGDKSSYTGSMLKEYAARADTTSEYMGILRNQVTLVSARIGQSMLPAVKEITQKLIGVGGKIADFVSKNQGLVTTVSKVVAGLLAAKMAFHGIQLAVGLIGQPIMAVYRGFLFVQSGALKAKAAMVAQKVSMIASKAAMLASAVATKVAAVAQWALNSAFLACPITWIVAGIAAVVAAGILLYKNWDKVKSAASVVWNAITGWLGNVKNKVVELWQSFQQRFPMIARIVQIATLPIQIAIQVVINVFKLLKAAGIVLWNGLKWCWNGIKTATVAAWAAIQQPLLNAWNKFKEFGAYIGGKFKSAFVSAWTGIRNKVSSVFRGLVGIVKSPMTSVISLVNKAIGAINKINVKIPDWAGGGSIGFNIAKIPQLAQGGIVDRPTQAIIGEGGEPEVVAPLSQLPKWARKSGIAEKSSGSANTGTINVTFSPVINISGGGGNIQQQVQNGLDAGMRNLKKEMEKLMREQRRLSYA